MTIRSFKQAIVDAQAEEMRRDPTVFLMGEGVENDVYGTTTGLAAEFGRERVRETPLSEAAFVGAAVGAAMTGTRPIVDLVIASFVYVAMDQLISQASKSRYMFGGQTAVPMVVRSALYYPGFHAAQHSDRPYPLFMHTPGLQVVVPSNPYDAKGLLKTAIRNDDVVLFFEDFVASATKDDLPDEDYTVPFGVASIIQPGTDVTIVAIGGAVIHARKAANQLAGEGISAEVIDPRTLVPLDEDTILRSVGKTGRLVIADPANRTCGAAAEIAAIVAEDAFGSLRSPVIRVTTPQTHIPFSPPLERPLYPSANRIVAAAHAACEWSR
jgi:pyruvate/2-oxoglutarate/acetoin dehydrogenase E1 component